MIKRSHLIAGLLLVIVALSGLFIYANLESYTHYVDEGPKLDVQLNPWNAAQRYLQRFNIESHRSFNLHPVLDKLQATDTLVLANTSAIKNPGIQRQLIDWIEDGGHLVLTAYNQWDSETGSSGDDFLDALGIRLFPTQDETEKLDIRDLETLNSQPQPTEDAAQAESKKDEVGNKKEIERAKDQESKSSCTFLYLDNINQLNVDNDLLQIEAVTGLTLEPALDVDAMTGEHFPNSLLQMPVASGKITVLLDTSIWQDPRIGELDHAYLLWYLVKDSTSVWLVSSDDSENLVQLLWRTAPYLLLTLLCILIIWAWQRWVRFGPLIQPTSTGNRKFTEHIEASARFEWNHGQAHTLLEPLRDEIKLRVSRHCLASYVSDQHEWLQYVSNIAHIDTAELAHIMSCEAPRHEQAWTHLVNQLQTLRNAL